MEEEANGMISKEVCRGLHVIHPDRSALPAVSRDPLIPLVDYFLSRDSCRRRRRRRLSLSFFFSPLPPLLTSRFLTFVTLCL